MENRFKGKQYPYHTLNSFYQEKYGEKVYKIAIDGGFTCPNRDGSLDDRGCIFCSESGSGDFAVAKPRTIKDRVLEAKERLSSKTHAQKFIVYFQSFTNTYGPADILETIYTSALVDDQIVGISIGTRPDCITPEIVNLLKKLQDKVDIYVELGLQTIHESTATFIRRSYSLPVYDQAMDHLSASNIPVITHLILGLPGESRSMMMESVDYVARTTSQGIKLQLLHILRDTDLYTYYQDHPFDLPDMYTYIDLIIDSIKRLPPHMVVHRITGDGPKDLLIEPKWSLNKRLVLGTFAKIMKESQAYQGQDFMSNKEISHD